jgi:hypothetical protein
MPNVFNIRRFGDWLARVAAVAVVVVLICVPALTRVGQRLETASHAPSFAKNIDCPPKKVTVAPATAMASPVPLDTIELVPAVPLASPLTEAPPRAPQFDLPVPLRAPPAVFVA